MKITMQNYRQFDINKLSEKAFSATLFGNPKEVIKTEEEGAEVIEYEVDVYRTGILPLSTEEEARAYITNNFVSILYDLITEKEFNDRLKKKAEAGQYLNSTDYRTLKAIRELPDVQAKLEELYPGELERNRAAAENAR